VQAAFDTEIHRYSAFGKTFFANANEPSVPSAFAGLIAGFRGLNDYPLKRPTLRARPPATISSQPDLTVAGSSPLLHYLVPDDFQTIYDLKPLYSIGINGTGQTIAIMGETDIVLKDIATFRSLSGLPAAAPQLVLVPGSSDPGVSNGDVQEASLDLEWSGATAPNATILYVYSTSVFGSLEYAVGENLAPVLSISYGSCEEDADADTIASLVSLTQQANAQGITIVAPSGDSGAAACDQDDGTDASIQGLTVELPASIPYVTGVGGTEFVEGNGSYWNSINNNVGGSALSYIPEQGWTEFIGESEGEGGGGASQVFTKPVWQTGAGVPNDEARDVPDISLDAAVIHDGYLICTEVQANPDLSTLTSGCTSGFSFNGSYATYGGTSFGAPEFAGILALINQETKSLGQGNINYVLYPLAATSPSAFHDITVGYNKVSCISGTPGCSTGVIGYTAGIGYDLATGLGSIDAFNLVTSWPSTAIASGTTPAFDFDQPKFCASGLDRFRSDCNGRKF